MWYVVQVVGGREEKTARRIEKLADAETFAACFVPKYEVRKRYAGAWQTRQEVLFPGYVFVDTKTPDSFRVELDRVNGLTRLLSSETESGTRRFTPLSDEEKTLISSLMGDDGFVLRMSEGVIEGDKVRVLRGPLQGREATVAKIDRHKRVAYIRISILGREKNVKVGLEIVEKR